MTDHKPSPVVMDIFSDKVSVGPKSVTIKISTMCNLHCEPCLARSPLINKQSPRHILPLSLLKEIIEDVIEISPARKIILSGGEPSCHPEILEIIDYIKNETQLFLQINSNLTFDKKSLRLGFAKADKLLVNMCAHDADIYSRQCHPPDNKMYRNLINNLKLFSTLRGRKGKPVVELDCVVTQHNYGALKKVIEFADAYHIPQLRFVAIGPQPETKEILVGEKEYREFKEFAKNMACKTKVKMRVTEYIGAEANNIEQLKACYSGWLRVFIQSDGSVLFCHRHLGLKAGNVREDSFKNIWFSQQAHALRLKLKHDLGSCRPPFMQCRSCDHTDEFLKIEDDLKNYAAVTGKIQ